MILNCKGPSPPDDRDHECPKVGVVKESMDWRPYLRVAENQGLINSCVAQGIESVVQVPVNILRNTDYRNGMKMVDMDASGFYDTICRLYYDGDTSRGAIPRDGMKVLKNIGMTELSPHSGQKHKIEDYWRNKDVDDVRRSVLSAGPATVAIKWYLSFDTSTGLLEPSADKLDPMTGYHQMAVVAVSPKWFILRNSHGIEWGQIGYAYVKPEHLQDLMVDSFGCTYFASIEERARMFLRAFS